MLRRFCLILKGTFGFYQEVPGEMAALITIFRSFIFQIPEDIRIFIVIDALNQLDKADSAHELTWLPEELPQHVKVVISCASDGTMEEPVLEALKRRQVHSLDVPPLSDDERRKIIRKVPSLSAKTLDDEQVDLLLDNPATINPLYLGVALEELRGFGMYEQLNERIASFPRDGEVVTAIFIQVIERLEEDFGQELVRTLLSMLASARCGLSEQELKDLVRGLKNSDDLFPLLQQLRPYLLSRAGLIDFYHRNLFKAAHSLYLNSPEKEHTAHLRLADYFDKKDLDARKVEELPWQLAKASAWQQLYDLLADLQFFKQTWDRDQFEVKGYWASVENGSTLPMVNAYRPVLDDPAGYQRYIWEIAFLFQDTGHLEEALSLRGYLVEYFQKTGDLYQLSGALCNQGLTLYDRGDLEGAMDLHKEDERLCRELGNKDGLQASIGNQANILYAQGDLDGAMALYKEQEWLCRELGNKDGLQRSLGNQGLILDVRGDIDRSMAFHKEQERLCRELGRKDGLQRSLGNQANILYACGEFDGAMALYKEQERLCRELGNKYGLSISLGNQGNILYTQGDLEGAMALYKEQERLCRELGSKYGLSISLGNQGIILRALGELDGAMDLYKEKERMCCELGNKDGLQASLNNQANILNSRGDPEGAMAPYKEQERLYRELGNKYGLQASLNNQGLILKARGELEGAMALYKEGERLCRELGNKDWLQAFLGNQANILYDKGDLDEAMTLYKEQERLCRELGNKDGLQASLGNQGFILKALGDLDGAMALYKDQERLCREFGNKDGLSTSLINQAELLSDKLGRHQEALPLAEEAYQIASTHGLTQIANQIKVILEKIREKIEAQNHG
jgi:tetratricopeptide (TPR) repeat protein